MARQAEHIHRHSQESWIPVVSGTYETRDDLLRIIEKKNGTPLFMMWAGVEAKVAIECSRGHVWSTIARTILYGGTWCPRCADNGFRLMMSSVDSLAARHGGRCLSTEYKNVHTKMTWMCKDRHIFDQTVNQIKEKGIWCPDCRKSQPNREWSFDEAILIATQAGGQHTGNTTAMSHKTSWQCANGHTWMENARGLIKRGYFCRACAGKASITIEDVRAEAARRGGRCLSTTYKNNRTNMEFECAAGHRWWAKWSNVNGNRSWCRECSSAARRANDADTSVCRKH